MRSGEMGVERFDDAADVASLSGARSPRQLGLFSLSLTLLVCFLANVPVKKTLSGWHATSSQMCIFN